MRDKQRYVVDFNAASLENKNTNNKLYLMNGGTATADLCGVDFTAQ
jgi:hypothetical protein